MVPLRDGAVVSTSWVADPGLTKMLEVFTEMDPSPALRILDPAVLNVTLKLATPEAKVICVGRIAAGSVEVRVTVPW